jgi:hypothetical protein
MFVLCGGANQRERHVFFWVEKKNTRGAHMLTKLPTYAVCSAMYFEDFSAPEPVAHEQPSLWSLTQKDAVTEDADWVFL